MNGIDIIVLIGVVTGVVLLLRFTPKMFDALARSTAGEPASLFPRGLMPGFLRAGQIFELQAIVSRLALITRLNLPLVPALEAAARNESYGRARVFREMAELVGNGVPLSEALSYALRRCPRQLILALRRAEAMGQLPEALGEQEQTIAATLEIHARSTAHTRQALAYGVLVLCIVGMLVAWDVTWAMPRFDEIFDDFGVPLPPVTHAFLDTVRWFVPNGLLILLAIGVVMILFTVARLVERDESGPVSRTVAALRWVLPVTRSLDYGLGMAKAIRAVAMGFRSGHDLSQAHTLPDVVCPTNHLKVRLHHFVQLISGGTAPSQAAGEAKLGDVFVAALRMVERGEDPDRVLAHAADYYEAIGYRWYHALMAVSGPVVTLALAAIVGFITVALFTPLVTLINSVTESIS